MSMPKTLDEIMATEMKQEIAGRYFGFRKLIEEDKLDLAQKIREYSFILQKRISFDLIRIYILLGDEGLIGEFLSLAGISERLFYDPYLTESRTIAARVFECQRFRGFTKGGRFQNYILDCYEKLVFHIGLYRQKIAELEAEQGAITEEIHLFYQQNDLNAILGFLKHLGDEEMTGAMQGGMETGLAEGLNEKLKIEVPLPIEQVLPVIPAPTPLAAIRSHLKRLCKKAYRQQSPELLAMFDHNSTPCPERESRID
ncbi:MAG: hypothetical protein ACOY8P_06730 [Thermodesulfobacteriota bacterium]